MISRIDSVNDVQDDNFLLFIILAIEQGNVKKVVGLTQDVKDLNII